MTILNKVKQIVAQFENSEISQYDFQMKLAEALMFPEEKKTPMRFVGNNGEVEELYLEDTSPEYQEYVAKMIAAKKSDLDIMDVAEFKHDPFINNPYYFAAKCKAYEGYLSDNWDMESDMLAQQHMDHLVSVYAPDTSYGEDLPF